MCVLETDQGVAINRLRIKCVKCHLSCASTSVMCHALDMPNLMSNERYDVCHMS